MHVATPRPAPPPARKAATVDTSYHYEPDPIEGAALVPGALRRPPMAGVAELGKRAPTLERARRLVAAHSRRPPARRAEEVHTFVALLWAEAHDKTDAEAKPLYTEGREALRALAEAYGKHPDETTLRQLAVADITLGDDRAASDALEELRARFPKRADAGTDDALLAYALLRQNRDDEAAKLAASWDPADPATSAEAAYVVAWLKFRGDDDASARAAISAAASRWKDERDRDAFEDDLIELLARTDDDPADAMAILTKYAGDAPKKRLQLGYELARKGYASTGRYRAAVAVYDLIFDDAIPSDQAGFRYRQADLEYRLQEPKKSADKAIAAVQLIDKCESCPASMRSAIDQELLNLGQRFHTVYARTFEDRWAEAAMRLYGRYVAEGGPNAEQAAKLQKDLELTRKRAVKSESTQSKEIMGDVIRNRDDVFVACYERALASAPDLAGDLTLTIAVNEEGKVVQATTAPPPGADGLSAVARCIQERVRAWQFPHRQVRGRTTLVWPLKLSVAHDDGEPSARPGH